MTAIHGTKYYCRSIKNPSLYLAFEKWHVDETSIENADFFHTYHDCIQRAKDWSAYGSVPDFEIVESIYIVDEGDE